MLGEFPLRCIGYRSYSASIAIQPNMGVLELWVILPQTGSCAESVSEEGSDMDCGGDDWWDQYQQSVLVLAASYLYCKRRKRPRRRFRVGKDPQIREQKGKYRVYVAVPNLSLHIVRCAYASRQYKLWAITLGACVKQYYLSGEYVQ